jgi:hypothetical protein
VSFNSAQEILDAFRELQTAAGHFEATAADWEAAPESVEEKADKLQQAFGKFAFLIRTSP